MRTTFLVLFGILLFQSVKGQDLTSILKKARTSYESKDYKKALEEYEHGMELINGKRIGQLVYYNAACSAALIGDKQRAIKYLQGSIDQGYHDVIHINKDSDFDSIKNSKKFRKILRKLSKRNDKLVIEELDFIHETDKEGYYTLPELKETFKKEFQLLGTGEPFVNDKEKSYTYLIQDVFERVKQNEEVRNRITKTLLDTDQEMIKELGEAISETSPPTIYLSLNVLRKIGSDPSQAEIFMIMFFDKGEMVYQIKGAVKNQIQMIHSNRAKGKIKDKLFEELMSVLE